MRDILAMEDVGGQPEGVEIALLLQPSVQCRDSIGGIRTEEATLKIAVGKAAKLALPMHVNPVSGCR